VNREQKIEQLLSQYKEIISQSRLKEEKYKWELLQDLQGRPNLNADNFIEEITSMHYHNLSYYNARTVLHTMARLRPEKTKACLITLFDENIPLNQRIANYQADFMAMYREAEPNHQLGHHQDERTISTYLAVKFPNKYPFYKYTFYRKYCSYLGETPAKTGEQYAHYIALLKELIEFIEADGKLLSLKSSFLKELSAIDSSNMLLAQDVLFQLFDKNEASQLEKVQKQFKPKEFDYFIQTIKALVSQFNLAYEDERVTYNVRDKRLIFTVGQRYGLVLSMDKKQAVLKVISTEKETEVFEEFAGTDRNPFLNYFSFDKRKDINMENFDQAIVNELNRTTRSSFKKDENIDLKNIIYNREDMEKSKEDMANVKKTLNQILYGPPGTGKTYHLQHNFFPKFTTTYESITFEQYLTNLVQNLSWWQVIGIALLEKNNSKVTDILENRWVSKKAEISESKNVRATIWGTLQMHTLTASTTVNYKQRQQPLLFDKNEDKGWTIYEEEVKDLAPELLEHLDTAKNFTSAYAKTIKRYEFITFHQSFSYEDFVEGIKPIILDEGESSGDIQYEVKSGVFKTLCKRAENDPDNDYALFIDEINRGNVSSIFGELITLIEEDKRKGNENELVLKLPYSRYDFSVPNNLFIIGTMNTADRSVEALDTALRRRFSFEEVAPQPELIAREGASKQANGVVAGVDLVKVLSIINQRIEKLIDKDHKIGHSYFMNIASNDDLRTVFKDKVIPLLEEYFFGDYGKIGLLLGNSFIRKANNNEIAFATFDNYDNSIKADLMERSVYAIKSMEDWDFTSIYALKDAE